MKSLQLKCIAAAVAAACSTAVFAAPPAQINPTSASFIAPTAANTIYISGATAQMNPLETVLKAAGTVFSFSAVGDLVRVAHGTDTNMFAYLGLDGSGNTFAVIYNGTNGSAAGLNQLLSTGTPAEAEASVFSWSNGVNSGCTGFTTNSGTPSTVSCTTLAVRETDMALSDVYANEFGSSGSLCTATGAGCPAATYVGLSGIKSPIASSTTGLEGFGLIANDKAYNTLLAQNIKEGILPASCSTATVTRGVSQSSAGTPGLCQPSIRSRDYASLVAINTGWDASVLTNGVGAFVLDNTPVQIHRRDQFSGSQAASNIFFLNNVCGNAGHFGALTPARATDAGTGINSPNLAWVEEPGTGNVETGVAAAATGTIAIGVVTTNRDDHVNSSSKAWWFVKIDGQSPNYNPDGSLDTTKRTNLLSGNYNFATEMAAYVRTTISGTAATLTTAIANGLQSSTVSTAGLPGIGFLDVPLNWPDGVQSKFSRGGNNCSPLH